MGLFIPDCNSVNFYRRERGFKYVPLNSMTLSKRKQPAKNSAEVTSEEQQTPKEDNEGRNKRWCDFNCRV